MKTILILLFAWSANLFAAPAQPAASSTSLSLELAESGQILLKTNTVGDLQINTEVMETSEGWWKGLSSSSKITPDAGNEITRQGDFKFPDGSEVAVIATAKIVGSDVVVKGSWPTTSTAPGFVRVDLRISEEVAKDLTIELDGAPVFSNFDKGVFLTVPGDLIFKKTSTGKFLFKMSGDYIEIASEFNKEETSEGLCLRISGYKDCNASAISEVTEQNWKLSFKE